MATIIETKHGFIAGDPPEILPEGHHWCDSCGGDGLEYQEDHEGEQYLTTCWSCSGCCTMPCDLDDCVDHPKPTDSRPPVLEDGTLGLGCGSLWSGADYTAWREDHLPACAICIGTYGDPEPTDSETGTS